MAKLTPEQRAFLRTRLTPALFRSAPLWLDMVLNIKQRIDAIDDDTPKPQLEPFTFWLVLQVLGPVAAIPGVIRAAVKAGHGPEVVHGAVSARVVEILRALLTDDTEASVITLFGFVRDQVDQVFEESGLWEVLDEADEVFDDNEDDAKITLAERASTARFAPKPD